MDDRKKLFNKVRFHALRRAMLENENVLAFFMDHVANKYDNSKLEQLDKLLIEIFDNELFNIIMGNEQPEKYKDKYDVSLLEEIRNTAKIMNMDK